MGKGRVYRVHTGVLRLRNDAALVPGHVLSIQEYTAIIAIQV